MINDYSIREGATLLRGSEDLKPSQFKEYEEAFRSAISGEAPPSTQTRHRRSKQR